jgi:tetratricopeptide (TPR) repeat protein
MKRFRPLSCFAVALAALFAGINTGGAARAMFLQGDEAPVDRLVENIKRYIEKKPKDPAAHYLLGRVCALAFIEKRRELRVYEPLAELPSLDEHSYYGDDKDRKQPTAEERKRYLTEAIIHYRDAVTLAPRKALYHLSLASVIEAAGADLVETELDPAYSTSEEPLDHFPDEKEMLATVNESGSFSFSDDRRLIQGGPAAMRVLRALLSSPHKTVSAEVRERIRALWTEEAIQHYWLAYMLNIKTEIERREDFDLVKPTSQEAAEHYLKLVRQRGPTEIESARIPQMERRGMAMTPIVFSESQALPLQMLLTPRTVRFDIDGDSIPDDIPWVAPGTSILVWDPKRTGEIDSGRRLFGSVTWWIFWRDGYEAMLALDDDGDGELRGVELAGLAVWRDVNGNGVSDPGEVHPVEETEIESLRVESTATVLPGPSPANPLGLRMKDGRVLPTYDWTLRVPPPPRVDPQTPAPAAAK